MTTSPLSKEKRRRNFMHIIAAHSRGLLLTPPILFTGLSLLAGCTGGAPVNEPALNAEVSKQTVEIAECERRLVSLQKAWEQYRKAHKGAEPSSVAALIPNYISDPSMLTCPTAKRWIDSNHNIGHGEITLDGKKVTTSYGFLWLTSGAARATRKLGEKAPLALCQAHTEALYIAAYNKMLRPGALLDDKRASLAAAVRDSKDIAVLRNGKVEHIAPDSL
jgi:hypothetical protein